MTEQKVEFRNSADDLIVGILLDTGSQVCAFMKSLVWSFQADADLMAVCLEPLHKAPGVTSVLSASATLLSYLWFQDCLLLSASVKLAMQNSSGVELTMLRTKFRCLCYQHLYEHSSHSKGSTVLRPESWCYFRTQWYSATALPAIRMGFICQPSQRLWHRKVLAHCVWIYPVTAIVRGLSDMQTSGRKWDFLNYRLYLPFPCPLALDHQRAFECHLHIRL